MTEHAELMTEAMKAWPATSCASAAAVRHPVGRPAGPPADPLLELGGALPLDEPTGNLDQPSADALHAGLESYQGTVLAVARDRWLADPLDRFPVFAPDGTGCASPAPVRN